MTHVCRSHEATRIVIYFICLCEQACNMYDRNAKSRARAGHLVIRFRLHDGEPARAAARTHPSSRRQLSFARRRCCARSARKYRGTQHGGGTGASLPAARAPWEPVRYDAEKRRNETLSFQKAPAGPSCRSTRPSHSCKFAREGLTGRPSRVLGREQQRASGGWASRGSGPSCSRPAAKAS